jgi:crotonobetainyl-CoA:carnitine CoA-transferase CaiB-like acyl-CoA transferase
VARTPPLGEDRLLVVDLGVGITGGYCTKLLADGGAKVIKVEAPGGDPLRARRLIGDPPVPTLIGSRLFRYLACSKSSVVVDVCGDADRRLLHSLLGAADAVLWQPGTPITDHPEFQPASIRRLAPAAVVCAISPFGLIGEPSRPTNQFTLQAMAGGSAARGVADRAPLAVGADEGEWAVSVFGAIGILTAVTRRESTGTGELVDVSSLDVLHLTQSMFPVSFSAAAARPFRAARVRAIPLIHPTSEGYVGFQLTTGQQWQDFCTMIGQEEWREDPSLTRFDVRMARFDEVNATVDAWTSTRSTDEVVELATLFRIPVAPVGNGETIPRYKQVVQREWVVDHPSGEFRQPEVFYAFHGSSAQRRPPQVPARLGADTDKLRAAPPARLDLLPTGVARPLPFAGLRILDFTAYWAGPIISHFFAIMGADVIHIESTKRPDGLRAATLKFDMSDQWWEAGPFFASTNTNKRDLTLDMSTEVGRELARRLMGMSDVVVENYSPRVFEEWGFGWEQVREINPSMVMVRAPGYGLSGPWRERVAYATTIEQACGAAWVTGFPDDRPDCTSGAMDPLAGSHAVFATLMALDHRRRTGEGTLVEVPQFNSGFNLLAELVIEYSATGRILGRVGNRSWTLAPQGTYRCADAERDMPGVPPDDWVSISVENDSQWLALCQIIGADALAASPELKTVDGRYHHHDAIDAAIQAWTRSRPAENAAAALCAVGVPAAAIAEAHHLDRLPEATARGLYEMVDHTVLPALPIVAYPAQFEAGPHRVHRRRSPLFGEHNREILEGLLGLSTDEVDALEEEGVIGNAAPTATAW